MKFLFLFFFLFFFLGVQGLTDEQKEKLKNHYKVCVEETGADKDLIKKTREGDFGFDDDKVKDFFFCLHKRAGTMSEDGTFLKDVALSKVSEGAKKDVEAAIDACLGNTGSTNSETAWNYSKCYYEKRPNDFKF